MANQNLLAIVTILILTATSGAAQQEPSLDDLLTIEKMIDSGDWQGLYSYVAAKPGLTTGQGPLAVELREFVDEVKRAQLTSFNAVEGPVGGPNAGGVEAASIY